MKLKALVVALALLGAGAANAGYIATTDKTDSAPVLLTMWNSAATTSAVFDLGVNRTSFTSNFGTTAGTGSLSITWSLGSNSVSAAYSNGAAFDLSSFGLTSSTKNSWDAAATTMGSLSGNVYDVIAFDRDGTTVATQHALTTGVTVPLVTSTALLNMGAGTNNVLFINGNAALGTHVSADNGADVVSNPASFQYQGQYFGKTWNTAGMATITANPGSSLNFYSMDGATSGTAKEVTKALGVWNLSADGKALRYTISNVAVAAVPEPSSIAMLLVGLGLMGFIARRRLA